MPQVGAGGRKRVPQSSLSMASSLCPCKLGTVAGLQPPTCVAYLEKDSLSKGQMPLEAQRVPRIRKSLYSSLGRWLT